MPRYIDADWLVQRIEGWQDQLAETYGQNDEYVLCLAEVLMKIDDAPTADVVEVVRCKECGHKYYDGNQIICQKLYWCDGNNFEPSAEDFCSQGERREE